MYGQQNVPFFIKNWPKLAIYSQKMSFLASEGPKGGLWGGGGDVFFKSCFFIHKNDPQKDASHLTFNFSISREFLGRFCLSAQPKWPRMGGVRGAKKCFFQIVFFYT